MSGDRQQQSPRQVAVAKVERDLREQAKREEAALVQALSGTPMRMEGGQIRLETVEDLLRLCKWVVLSGLAPRGIDSVSKAFVVICKGREAGLDAMRALASVDVIEGVPAWKTKAALGMVRASGKLKSFSREYVGTPFDDDFACVVRSTRADTGESLESSFSVADAKRAELWGKKSRNGKPSPWILHPKRMLYNRAVGFLVNDLYQDVVGGWDTADAVREWAAKDVTPELEPERPERDPRPTAGPSDMIARLAAGESPQTIELPRRQPDREPVVVDVQSRREEPAPRAEPEPPPERVCPECRAAPCLPDCSLQGEEPPPADVPRDGEPPVDDEEEPEA